MSDFSDRLAELMRGAGNDDSTGATDPAVPAGQAAAAEPADVAPVVTPPPPPPAPPAPQVEMPAAPTAAQPAPGGSHREPPASQTASVERAQTRVDSMPAKRGPNKGRFDDLKESVHEELLVQLGPKLYDANLSPGELEAMVRQALADVMAASDRPRTSTDRQRITQEIADD
ncbi:MAG TPA: hypothetical protein VFE07_03350, partial [Marmoricola sp.]|nr:hypothetical protein [Marmoricola sp.]